MARRRSGKLFVSPLEGEAREVARGLAETYLRFARAHVGRSRESLLETCRQIAVGPREKKLAQGLLKLILDRCDFREETSLDPVEVRQALFMAATEARRRGTPPHELAREHAEGSAAPSGEGREARSGGVLEDGSAAASAAPTAHAMRSARHALFRERLMAEIAARFGVDVEALERALYADLPAAHVLAGAPALDARALVDGYEMAQWQAVLLRAVKVRARVFCASPDALRALFRRLKFLGLIHQTATVAGPRGRPEHEITLDGPFSLFESVTRYGLALGLALPAIAACDAWSLEAELRWGAAREPLVFQLAGRRRDADRDAAPPSLRDEVRQLLARLQERETGWEAAIAEDVLDLAGLGVCIPDLALRHRRTGRRVLVEVLGFWSRDAVFKRLELVRAGLDVPLVFVASRHLRVSEALLDDTDHAALYVYARVMDPAALLARAAAVAGIDAETA
jgi:predicted nuclease of restriction endonuclease-like RecB superfamily